jgi:ADP-ribose pyrophosphatase YjhB (NUDIX family)
MEISAGFVIIQDNKILLAHPTGSKWFGTYSIPKGKVEENETILEAAIRETKEELGIEVDGSELTENDKRYINYIDKDGETYKRVYYYVVEPIDLIRVDNTNLQKKEVDWAGFLTKEEAEKRIFGRFKSLLDYLK